MAALTIGMATYNDFGGVYLTLQSLRLYQDLHDTELLVVDNYGCPDTKRLVEGWVHGARYVLATEVRGTAAAKDLVFREAQGEAVLCCDSHVLFAPGAIRRLKEYYREPPECPDLLQGPLVYDDLQTISTHFEPVWRGEMWGIWATDPRGQDPEGEPFEIPMQGMGAFSCRKGAWPGFNPMFRGFGWEEGYIHEKIRRAVPLLALVAMDASLRQACRSRVSSYRRRETKELPHRARRARVGSRPRAGPLLRDLARRSRCRRRGGGAGGTATGTRTSRDDASGGRRRCGGRGRRRAGGASGRGRPDTAKPTTRVTARPTTGSVVDRVRAGEDRPDGSPCWEVCIRGPRLRRGVRGRANGVGGSTQQPGRWRLEQVRTRGRWAGGEGAVGQLYLPHL